jgi:hypothetical protein
MAKDNYKYHPVAEAAGRAASFKTESGGYLLGAALIACGAVGTGVTTIATTAAAKRVAQLAVRAGVDDLIGDVGGEMQEFKEGRRRGKK